MFERPRARIAAASALSAKTADGTLAYVTGVVRALATTLHAPASPATSIMRC